MWRETTKHDRNLKIFREEFDDFLPERIVDFHVHAGSAQSLGAAGGVSAGGHWLTEYRLETLARDLAELYPGREIRAVCFGFPKRDGDLAAGNAYLAQACAMDCAEGRPRRFYPLRLFDPNETDRAAVRRELENGGFWGVKPYPAYAAGSDPEDVEIRDMLPDWILEIVQDLGRIVMLHLPRRGRLADPVNRRQLAEICRDFPRARIVLAHAGRAYFLRAIVGHLEPLCRFDNLWFDLEMLNHWEVLEHLFAHARQDRVLYATDTPIALAPGKSVEINDQYTYVTPVPWELSICDSQGRIRFASFAYEELRAIKRAVWRLGLGADFVEDLMWRNGTRLLESPPRAARTPRNSARGAKDGRNGQN